MALKPRRGTTHPPSRTLSRRRHSDQFTKDSHRVPWVPPKAWGLCKCSAGSVTGHAGAGISQVTGDASAQGDSS